MEIISIAAFYLYTVLGYFWFSARPTDNHFKTPWEDMVPIVPALIVPYLLATITFLVLPIYFYAKLGWKKTRVYLVAQTIATTIGYLFYQFFPSSVVREPLTGEGIFWDALRLLHANDRPSAAFPSGHVYHSTVMAYFLWIYFPKSRPLVAVIYLLVVLSTVMLKQHHIPDIFGGLVTGILSIIIVMIINKK